MNTPTAMAAPHFSPETELAEAKAALRARALERRAAQNPGVGLAVARHVLSLRLVPRRAAVAGVWPLPGEIDMRPLWLALHAAGHTILLPQTTPRGQALIFRVWHPEVTMLPERFGTQCPDGPEATPDLIFVPLLAFDGAGARLGYGGGYYDRTLAANPQTEAVGFGYAALRVDSVPTGPHDQLLSRIVTEDGLAVDLTANRDGTRRAHSISG